MNITKRFADRLFALGFRIAYWFFRRPPAKAVAQSRLPLTRRTGSRLPLARSLGKPPCRQAQRQQADPTIR